MANQNEIVEYKDRSAIIRNHVRRAYTQYGLSPELLQVQEGHLLERTTELLRYYDMDDLFYVKPENTLFALAFTQERELALQSGDDERAQRSLRAFELLTASKGRPFSYSARVREELTENFTSIDAPIPLRRPNSLQLNATYRPLTDCLSMDFGGKTMAEIIAGVEKHVGKRARYGSSMLRFAIADKEVLANYNITGITTGRDICVAADCDPNIVMHELVHGYVGLDLLRGHKDFFLRGILEALTESLTWNPVFYQAQREVVAAAYQHLGDKNEFARLLGLAYTDGQTDGMWKMLIEAYGLQSVAFWGLLDSGAPTFMSTLLGEENAHVYIPTEDALEFFSHPRS